MSVDAPGRKPPRWRRTAWLAGVLVPVLLVAGLLGVDAVGRWRFNAHAEQWRQAIARELPAGTAKPEVLAFFAARGVPLSCTDAVRGQAWCSGRERRGFGVMPVWSLSFEASLQDDRLLAVRQQARGVGF